MITILSVRQLYKSIINIENSTIIATSNVRLTIPITLILHSQFQMRLHVRASMRNGAHMIFQVCLQKFFRRVFFLIVLLFFTRLVARLICCFFAIVVPFVGMFICCNYSPKNIFVNSFVKIYSLHYS